MSESTSKKNEQTKQANPTEQYRPGLEGVIACRSSVSHVDGGKGILEYRGIGIQDLAENSSFEETAYLLLYSHLPSEREFSRFNMLFSKLRTIPRSVANAIQSYPVGMHPMISLQSAVSLLQGDDYYADDITSPQHNIRRAISLIAKIPTIIAAFERYRHGEEPLPPASKYTTAENFLFMLTGEPPDKMAAREFDRFLILHAEHSLNLSTFVARCIASSNSSIYSSISGAIGALSGPLHGGANERVLRMLYSIGHPNNVEKFVEEELALKNRIMGIGHRVYKVKDPRAIILEKNVSSVVEKADGHEIKRLFEIAQRLESIAKKKLSSRDLYPNVDFYSGVLLEAMGIPVDLFTPIFAMSRAAGWCAHWIEQIGANRLFRPSQEYIGDHERPYLSIDKR
jgi:citrate synthase